MPLSSPEPDRSARVQQVMDEVFRSHARGEPIDESTILANHPELQSELREAFRRWRLITGGRQRARLDETTDGDHDASSVDARAPGSSATTDPQRQRPSSDPSTDALQNEVGEPVALPTPKMIDRYLIKELIGTGGFGRVYRAYDGQLDRTVAIKVPHAHQALTEADRESYRREARIAASLDHPGIVPVYDVGTTEDGLFFIVAKFIAGDSLREWMRRHSPSYKESARIIQSVAQAVHHAHTRDLVHRDIKPNNILVDASGHPYITDFGLAMRDSETYEGFECVGTPAYMSPEQARGEVHLIDGRSDIFSLGVVFYEVLTGVRPFKGENVQRLLEKVRTAVVRPLRQRDSRIPPEVERICMRALQKRAADRYSTAADLSHDLQRFLQSETTTAQRITTGVSRSEPLSSQRGHADSATDAEPVLPSESHAPIVPKGLRAYDVSDAGFYLRLLPGPLDYQGLPPSVCFWLDRIGNLEDHDSFRVGVVLGPSGSGKSSLIRAGVIPRLPKHVLPVIVEAIDADTIDRLRRALVHAFPSLHSDWALPRMMSALRSASDHREHGRVLLVIDQFEQCLQRCSPAELDELTAALRHCDGAAVQCLLVVRDDFWLATERLTYAIENPLIEGRNSAVVDRFTRAHATHVLAQLGRALGDLPADPTPLSADQQSLIDTVVEQVADHDRVVAVQIVMLAQMLHGKRWSVKTLRDLGGAQGIGVAFLEEILGDQAASPERRLHQSALRAILNALLPPPGVAIRGQARATDQLLRACGYEGQQREFHRLLQILDRDLKIITPVSSDQASHSGAVADEIAAKKIEQNAALAEPSTTPASTSYQLAHDSLVPALREWISIKQRETRRGRAQLRMEQLSVLWAARRDNRLLPSLAEFLGIRTLVPRRSWSPAQRLMMTRAARYYGLRTLVVLVLAGIIGACWSASVARDRFRQYLVADAGTAADDLSNLSRQRWWLGTSINDAVASDHPRTQRRGSIALVTLRPARVSDIDPNVTRLAKAALDASVPIDELPLLWQALAPYREQLSPAELREQMRQAAPAERAVRAASLLAKLFPAIAADDPMSPVDFERILRQLVESLRRNPEQLGTMPLLNALRPYGTRLRGLLEIDGEVATAAYLHAFRDHPSELRYAILRAQGSQLAAILDSLRQRADDGQRHVVDELPLQQLISERDSQVAGLGQSIQRRMRIEATRSALARTAEPTSLEQLAELTRSRTAIDQQIADQRRAVIQATDAVANAAISQWYAGTSRADAARLWHDPALRWYLIGRCANVSTSSLHVTEQLVREIRDQRNRPTEDLALASQIVALGKFSPEDIADPESVGSTLIALYREHPNSAVHGAVKWVLQSWSRQSDWIQSSLADVEQRTIGPPPPGRQWWVSPQGQTFVRYDVGGQPWEVTDTEVTEAAFATFLQSIKQAPLTDQLRRQQQSGSQRPCRQVTWFQAARYCNWLSDQADIDPDQWCYLPNSAGEYADGMQIAADHPQRRGYRLLSVLDWKMLALAHLPVAERLALLRDPEVIDQIAWYRDTPSEDFPIAGSKMPNRHGIFDLFGSVWEWSNQTPTGQVAETVSGDLVSLGGSAVTPIQSLDMYYSPAAAPQDYVGFRVIRRVARGPE